MQKLTWTWKKVVAIIGASLGIGTLVSCYGVVNPERFDDESQYERPAENPDDTEENQQSDVE